jgi:hypothetical protein
MPDALQSGRVKSMVRLCVCLVVLSIPCGRGHASDAKDAASLRAAFIYNFTRYVTWPETAFDHESSPVRVCLLADAHFLEKAQETIVDRKANGRPVLIEPRTSPQSLDGCHVLYIDADHADQHASILSSSEGRSIFTLSDTAGFAEMGGVANFFPVGKKLRFEINLRAAEDANLKLSARLLRVSKVLDGTGRP